MQVADVGLGVCWVDAHLHHVDGVVGHQVSRHLRLVRARQLGLRDAVGEVAVLLALRHLELAFERRLAGAGRPGVKRFGVPRAQRPGLEPRGLLLATLHQAGQRLPGRRVGRQLAQRFGQRGPRPALQGPDDAVLWGIPIVEPQGQRAGLVHPGGVLPHEVQHLSRRVSVVQVQMARKRKPADRHGSHLGDADRAPQQL